MIIRMRLNLIQLTLALLGNTESSPKELYDFDKSQPGVIVVISDHQENLGRFFKILMFVIFVDNCTYQNQYHSINISVLLFTTIYSSILDSRL